MIFKEETIGNISNRIFSGGTPDTRKNDYWNGNLNWLSSGETRNKYIYKTEKNITQLGADNSSTRLAHKGDIVIASAGQGYTRGQTSMLMNDMYINQSLICIECDKSKVNNYYLFYLLSSQYDKLRFVSNENSSRGSLTTKIINEYSVKLPTLENQTKIVNILKALDGKIELNNEINNNLSEQIKSIYNEIFTEFIDYKRLDEISNVTIGKTPPRSEQECFTTDKNDVKWISISDLGKSGMFIFDTSEKLTQEAVDKYNVKVIPKDTVILSFKLTVGRTGFTTEDMTTNEAIAHFDLNNKELNNYLYCTLTYYNYSDLGSTSSIATAINSKIVKSIKIGIPSDEQLNKFNNLTSAMFKTIKNNESENIKLSELRDTLLPKLMNGEIDLDKIEL